MQSDHILEMRGIVKKYPGVIALKGVDFFVKRNTVHCLVGENGAGKSTLIKILTCVERMTQGAITLDGAPFHGKSVRDAMDAGISTVYQELNIIDQLTVAENLTLGRERAKLGVIDRQQDAGTFDMLREFAPDISLNQRVSTLSFAEKQLLEIVKAVSADAKLVIMDEPTAALSRRESDRLYEVVRKLKARGIKPIFLTGHTGWSNDFEFAFRHKDRLCSMFRKRVNDPGAPYDAYDESDDTEQKARTQRIAKVKT